MSPIRTLPVLLAFLTVLAPCLSATAQPADTEETPDLYLEYSIGVSYVPKQTLRGSDATGAGLWGRTRSSPGIVFGGALGYEPIPNVRTELRISHRTAEVQRIAVQGEPSPTSGDVSLLSIMANGYYDVDLGLPVVPWVGAGIGWGMLKLDAQNAPTALQTDIDDTDSLFVWNVMVGGTMPISEVTELSLGYRYVRTQESSVSGTAAGLPQRFDYEFDAHEGTVSLRFLF